MSSCERRTMSLTRFLNAVRSFRHMTAASMLAGDSSLGSESMDMTDTIIASTPKIGLQRSIADSCGLCTSSPGGCKIEMHTLPSSCTVELIKSERGGTGWDEKQQRTAITEKDGTHHWGARLPS